MFDSRATSSRCTRRWPPGSTLRRILWPWGVPDEAELVGTALRPRESRDDIHQVAVLEAQFLQVTRTDQDHPAAVRDTAVPVIQAVERGVVLVVAADSLEDQMACRSLKVLKRPNGETPPLADVRGKGTGIPGRVGEDEAVLGADPGVKSSKPGMTREIWSRITS